MLEYRLYHLGENKMLPYLSFCFYKSTRAMIDKDADSSRQLM